MPPGSPSPDNQLEQLRLNSLLEISQRAAELSEREIIQLTLEEVVQLTHSEIGYLHFVNPDQETIRLFTWSEQSLRNCTATHDSHYPISSAGVWADCARLRKPVVHNNYQDLPGKRGYPEGHSHLTRHASIPIRDGEDVVVILGVGNKAEDYDDADVRQMLLAADGLWKIILRKRAEEALHEHVRALEEADRRKNQFLAMLAHELRNPLAPIRSALEILDRPGVDRGLVEQAGKVIGRQVNQMTRLVNDLLEISRITQGKVTIQREQVDLVEIIQAAVEINRDYIEARQHRLQISQPAFDTLVCGDRIRLTQVVGNLLHNAAKYMADRGQIELTLERTQEHAILRVKDCGVGIAPEMLSQVFDLFVQADESLDRSQGGLGLGLTLVRQLVELHGGTVSAFSDGLHQGSEFVVRLPRVSDATSPVALPTEPSTSTARRSGCRILVVDDNRDAACMLAALLDIMGHAVQSVHDGHCVFAAVESFRPDVVLLDIGLPGMDGFQVAEQVRRQYSRDEVLLIALTGYGHDEAIQRGRAAGIDHHLVKPLDPNALEVLLAEHRTTHGS